MGLLPAAVGVGGEEGTAHYSFDAAAEEPQTLQRPVALLRATQARHCGLPQQVSRVSPSAVPGCSFPQAAQT
jgi:hypothetical protein